MSIKIYNSLTRKTEVFKPINPPEVGMYTCGFTVYDYAHIGSGRKYANDDLLRRTLTYLGYKVKHVQNVTDVGHLVSDADEGEDKMEKGARKSGKTVWEVAEFYTSYFYASMDKLNILRPHVICKATQHIPEQIKMITKLIQNGYAYETEEAVYFDVLKFPSYGMLFSQNLTEKKQAVRQEVYSGEHKKSPYDFVLWFKRTGRFKNHSMHWDSPWGDGFPGWHIECSAMSIKYLGEQFDIHTGGEDHLPVHHPNEIAQSEASTAKRPFVKYWVHHAFLVVDGKKMSKSLQNFYTVDDVINKGYDPLALRYLYLTTHYRKKLNFTWKALKSAQSALIKLRNSASELGTESSKNIKNNKYITQFTQSLADDLNFPKALAVVWEVLKSSEPDMTKRAILEEFDKVLGLEIFKKESAKKIPSKINKLLKTRDELRDSGNYLAADKIRLEIESLGFKVIDTDKGSIVG